jgi:hypothetical protein
MVVSHVTLWPLVVAEKPNLAGTGAPGQVEDRTEPAFGPERSVNRYTDHFRLDGWLT